MELKNRPDTRLQPPDPTCHSQEGAYNTLMNSLRIGVSRHLLDPYFTVIWANRSYYEMTGYTREEYKSEFHNQCSEYFRQAPGEYAKIENAVRTALAQQKEDCDQICQMPCRDGSRIWIRFMGTISKETENGYPVVYVASLNIQNFIQVQVEQTVAYGNLPGFVGKFRVGEQIEFMDANDRFLAFFGKQKPGDPPYSLVPNDAGKNKAVLAEHYPAMRAGRPVHFVVQTVNQLGEDSWLQLNAECVGHMDDDPVYLVIYIDITDITEQRELQKKVEERSEMLRRALDMAERASLAKSDFLSRMSHDLRTPMNAIMGMTSIAQESLDDRARVADCLEKVQSSSKFLLTLLNDILDMSKIDSGKIVQKKKRIDFVQFIRNIAAIFYAQAHEKKLDFQVTAESGLQEAYIGDELKLNQIVINLLNNAVKFTDPGGHVTLSVAQGKKMRQYVELVFTVSDTGIGMSRAFIDRIFVPFEQEGNLEGGRGGSGLGLAIAGNYARMMNGWIDVKSQPGTGSIFTAHVWLESAAGRAKPAVLEDLRSSGRRILVADPNPSSCKYAADLFADCGAEAGFASSCQEALCMLDSARAAGRPYHMILVDQKISQEDGLDFIRTIRRRYYGADIQIAFASFDKNALETKAREAGGDFFLQKPIFLSTVTDILSCMKREHGFSNADGNASFAGERVLLVEDNDMNLEIAKSLLEARSLQVETARDGQEALEHFQNSEPGRYLVILMDLQMPVMDGYESARRIRALQRKDAKTVPIIAMSANSFAEDVEKSLNAGMDAHIPKPLDISFLFDTLRRCQHGEIQ